MIWLIYNTLGRWGVLGLFGLAGLLFIGGAVLTMMGKSTGSDSDSE